MSAVDDFKADVSGITARRWFGIRRALDMTSDQITDDPIATMVVVCNERERRVNGGKDAWDKFLAMTPEELSDYLGISDADVADAMNDDDGDGEASFQP